MAKIIIGNTSQRVANAGCLLSDAVGDYVYALPFAGTLQVAKADIANPAKMPCIGVIVEKFSTTTCLVLYDGIWTPPGGGLVPNKRYWIGSAGQATVVRPSAPSYLQLVAQALDETRLLVKPELDMTKVI